MDFFKNDLDEEFILSVWIPLTLISWPLWLMLLRPRILEAKKGTSGHLTQSQSLTLSRAPASTLASWVVVRVK